MVRYTGDIVLQSQAVFLTSFRSHRAPLPVTLDPYFPVQPNPGTIPAAVVQVVPGGFSSAVQSIRELIDGSDRRLDIMNPYLTDRDMIERIIAAAERGVAVRVVISESSNNFMAAGATRYRYGDLLEAGVELYEYPDAVVHAKLIVADGTVHFGTVNLDAWALYRDFEFAVQAESVDAAALLEERVFEPTIAGSRLATAASGFDRVTGWLFDKITYVL
jgi:cardiolipin synthase